MITKKTKLFVDGVSMTVAEAASTYGLTKVRVRNIMRSSRTKRFSAAQMVPGKPGRPRGKAGKRQDIAIVSRREREKLANIKGPTKWELALLGGKA